MTVRRLLAGLALSVVPLVSCGGDAAPTPTTAAPAATPTTTTAPASTTSTTSAELTTADLYDAVSPSLAFIQTELSTGSGILLDSGWVITNAHVVWPADRVRVVFPDGNEYKAVPVVRSDVYEDLAVLGPITTSTPGLSFDSDVEYAIGDTVFLVGYPGEVERFPTPAITQGVISRLRTWDATGLSFIQTDALIAGGQSGGALVSRTGELLGISGLGGFTESNFALVATVRDLQTRIDDLISGNTPGRFDIHPVAGAETATEYTVELASFWHEAIFVINEPGGTDVTISVSSGDHIVDLTDSLGYSLSEAEELSPSIEATTEYSEPHFVYVASRATGPTTVTVTSSHPMARWIDPDDDQTVAPGDSVRGVLDISGEIDVYRIDLDRGETITVAVDGLLDSLVWIDRIGNPDEPLAVDDDAGGGLYGTNARLRFTARDDGEHLILVSDAFFEPGVGYVLTIE